MWLTEEREMPGPAPKDPSTRQRRNRVSTGTELTSRKGRQPTIPIKNAHRMTRDWWRDVWASPMASQYTEPDRHGLAMLCVLVEDYWTAEDAKGRRELAGEIRQQGVRFGLSPIDRRRLQWSIPQGAQAPAKASAAAKRRGSALVSVPAGPDPRDVLTA
jgi:hypothetical protein